MTSTELQERRVAVVLDYFHRVDHADPTLVDLYTDDAVLYFPKLGTAHGKREIAVLAQGFAAEVVEIEHDVDNFLVIASGNHVVVEGRERGRTRSSGAFPDGVYSQGRFCNVFEFRDEKICRVSIYTDPDFTSADQPRLAWASTVHHALTGLRDSASALDETQKPA